MPAVSVVTRRDVLRLLALGAGASLAAACAPAAQPSPTAAPAKPAAQPTAAAAPAAKPTEAPKPAAPAAATAAPAAPAAKPTEAAKPAAGAPAAAAPAVKRVDTSVKVAVSHLNSILSNAQFAVGRGRGHWDDFGLKQELVEYAGGGDSVRGVTSGANAYGQVAPTAAISAFVRGEKIRLIGTSYGALTIKFLVQKDAPYRTIKDIEGKKVGYSTAGSNTHFLVQESLKQAGVKAQIVAVGGAAESVTALRTGVVDASWAAEPVPSLNQDTLRVLWDANEFVPHFSETVLITTADYAEKNGDVLRAFLAGYDRGNQFIKSNPDEAARVWAREVGYGERSEQIIKAFREAPREAWTLQLNARALEAIERSMRELNQIDKPVEWKTLVDQSFLPEGLRITL